MTMALEGIRLLDLSQQDEVSAYLTDTFKTRTRDEWFEFFKDKNVCVTPVLSIDETQNDPHLREREMFVDLHHHKFGTIRQTGLSVKLSETPGRVRSLGPLPGEHTDAIMKEMGYTENEVDSLRKSGAVK